MLFFCLFFYLKKLIKKIICRVSLKLQGVHFISTQDIRQDVFMKLAALLELSKDTEHTRACSFTVYNIRSWIMYCVFCGVRSCFQGSFAEIYKAFLFVFWISERIQTVVLCLSCSDHFIFEQIGLHCCPNHIFPHTCHVQTASLTGHATLKNRTLPNLVLFIHSQHQHLCISISSRFVKDFCIWQPDPF